MQLGFHPAAVVQYTFTHKHPVAAVQYTFTHKQYTEKSQNKQYIEQHKHFGIVLAVPRLCELYPGICLRTEVKPRKNLRQGSRRDPAGTMKIHNHTIIINRHNKYINYSIKQEYNYIHWIQPYIQWVLILQELTRLGGDEDFETSGVNQPTISSPFSMDWLWKWRQDLSKQQSTTSQKS
jgi:hypothetical protein